MRLTRWLLPLAERNNRFILPAIFLGTTLGLFVSGYWLGNVFPAESKQLLGLTILAGVAASAGYFLLLGWTHKALSQFSASQNLTLAGVSLLIGVFVFFAGTDPWRSSQTYLTLFLPSHRLQISASGAQGLARTSMLWFNTSLGDVSYNEMEYHGWKRVGEQLVLQDPLNNSILWNGKVGDNVQIVFSRLPSDGQLSVAWDGEIELLNSASAKSTYTHTFGVPSYASREFVVLLGLITFVTLSEVLVLLLWQKRDVLIGRISDSLGGAEKSLDIRDGALVLSLIVLASLLRVFNLASLFPAVDEYYQLIAARQILAGAALSSVYPRSLWIVTLPVALALRIFGNQLWAARLVGVCFNVLAIIPLYLLTRKINRPVAAIASILYATSPWIITFARLAREYAYYPFYFYWIVYGMVTFIEGIPQGFILSRHWKALLSPKMILLAACLAVVPLYALTVEWLSTFKTILIAYPVFAIFVLARINLRDRQNLPMLALLGAGVIAAAYAVYEQQLPKLVAYPKLNVVPIEYFFPNPQQQWYFNRGVIVIAIGFLAAGLFGFMVRHVNSIPTLFLALFVCFLGTFALLSKTFFHTRHLSTTELWFVVVTAIGLYMVWHMIRSIWPLPGRQAPVLIAALLGLSILNGQQILLPTVSSDPNMPISEDYLHDVSLVQAFMLKNAQPSDVLISTVYGLYATWQEQPVFQTQFRITTQTPEAYIISTVDQYPSGWIVIDQIRLGLSSMTTRQISEIDQVQYVGEFGDEYVWHWEHGFGLQSSTALVEKGR